MKNIYWYNIDKNGFIISQNNKALVRGPPIYIYRFKNDKFKFYIGSTNNVYKRFATHRYNSFKSNLCNRKFYRLVNKYGWNNLEFGLLESVNFP